MRPAQPGQPTDGVRVAADGTFRLAGVRPEWTTDYRARFAGDPAGHEPMTSELATTEQRVRVRLGVDEKDLRLGHSRVVTGSVSHHSHACLPITLVIRRDGEVVDERPLTLEPSPATEIAGCGPVRRALRRVDALLAQWTSATARPSPPTEPEYHFSYRPSRPGKHTSLGYLLQGVDVQRLVGNDPLQPLVLALQLSQALDIVGLHPAELALPAVIRRLAGLQVAADLADRLALGQQAVGLAQLADHLLRSVPACLHRVLLAHHHGRIGLSQAPHRTPGVTPHFFDPDERARIAGQLNKGETLHAMRRHLVIGSRAQIPADEHDHRRHALSLQLLVNAIQIWNARYMTAAIDHLHQTQPDVVADEQTIARVAPVAHAHVNSLGRYELRQPPPAGKLRPLRDLHHDPPATPTPPQGVNGDKH